jgi:hypothetical protein
MFKCLDCDYKSNRRYNLKTHILRKHKREIKEEECIKIKEIIPLKCLKCNKEFKTKQGLNYHINICNGVANKLECPYCHKVYASISSKSHHLKICKTKLSSLIEVKKEDNKETTIINNGTINNGTVNNGTINNGTINNNITINNIINFNYNDYIEFIRTHINAEEMNKMLRENRNEDIIIEYFNKLYTNPLNRCIKRESERSGKSKVKVGEEWKEERNKVVYPNLSLSVSKSLNQHLDDLMDEEKIKKSLSNIASDISILTDDILDKAPEIEIQQLKKKIIKALQFKLLSYK